MMNTEELLDKIEKALEDEFYIDEYSYHDAPSKATVVEDVMDIIRRRLASEQEKVV